MPATLTKPQMPRTPKRNDRTVRIDADVAHMAGIVAAYKDKNLNEYLSETLKPIVEKQLAEEQEKARKIKGGPVGPPGTSGGTDDGDADSHLPCPLAGQAPEAEKVPLAVYREVRPNSGRERPCPSC